MEEKEPWLVKAQQKIDGEKNSGATQAIRIIAANEYIKFIDLQQDSISMDDAKIAHRYFTSIFEKTEDKYRVNNIEWMCAGILSDQHSELKKWIEENLSDPSALGYSDDSDDILTTSSLFILLSRIFVSDFDSFYRILKNYNVNQPGSALNFDMSHEEVILQIAKFHGHTSIYYAIMEFWKWQVLEMCDIVASHESSTKNAVIRNIDISRDETYETVHENIALKKKWIAEALKYFVRNVIP